MSFDGLGLFNNGTIQVMPERTRKKQGPEDVNEIAFRVFQESIGETPKTEPNDGKDPAAVALGRKGGKVGGKVRASSRQFLTLRIVLPISSQTCWKVYSCMNVVYLTTVFEEMGPFSSIRIVYARSLTHTSQCEPEIDNPTSPDRSFVIFGRSSFQSQSYSVPDNPRNSLAPDSSVTSRPFTMIGPSVNFVFAPQLLL